VPDKISRSFLERQVLHRLDVGSSYKAVYFHLIAEISSLLLRLNQNTERSYYQTCKGALTARHDNAPNLTIGVKLGQCSSELPHQRIKERIKRFWTVKLNVADVLLLSLLVNDEVLILACYAICTQFDVLMFIRKKV
jgi:hypothetical protein